MSKEIKWAAVTNKNTPESDKQTHVWNTVTYMDGTTEQIWATDPMDAIRIVNERPEGWPNPSGRAGMGWHL